jgi:hypothetical protein
MPAAKAKPTLYQLKMTLLGIEPPIWRRIQVPSTMPQCCLYDAIQKPVCLAGKRRCPPEDVGGVPGYHEFLEVIFEPGHEEFTHFRGWAGGKFHAEESDLEALNAVLKRMRWPVRHRR